ncbi:MAG: hypothetical protein RLZ35_368 [Pseudomonadota bacterium]|jgi:prepilin-type N-terminal cleavage/methylation domain-containing protein
MNIKHKNKLGFTLIEVMIAIAVISILAYVSSTAYQKYIIRSRVATLLDVAAPAKLALSQYIDQVGPLGTCDANSLTSASVGITPIADTDNIKYTTVLGLSHGCVIEIWGRTAEIAPSLPGYVSLVLCPTINTNGSIQWTCMHFDSNGTAGPWKDYVPVQCQSVWFHNGGGVSTCGH